MSSSDIGDGQLARELKRYRLEREWSLKRLSAVTGMAISSLWQIENGKVRPHELTVHRLKRSLPGFMAEEPDQVTA
jgi:transcriptional regulator with XRE-family HTH domain